MTKQTLKKTKKKKTAHTGFRVRMKTNSGRNIIKRRKDKGRNKLVP